MPPLLLRALGLVNPTMRVVAEMQYQFDETFIVDSSKIATKLGVPATPSGRHSPTPSPATALYDTALPGHASSTGAMREGRP
jgi:hypothetical protein